MIGSLPLRMYPLALSMSATDKSQNEQSACAWCKRSLPLGHFDDSRVAFTMIVSKIFLFRRDDFGIFLAAHRRKTLRQLSILRPRNV